MLKVFVEFVPPQVMKEKILSFLHLGNMVVNF